MNKYLDAMNDYFPAEQSPGKLLSERDKEQQIIEVREAPRITAVMDEPSTALDNAIKYLAPKEIRVERFRLKK